MAITPKQRRNFSRILPFGFIWLFISIVLLVNDISITRNQNINPDTDISLTWPVLIFANLMMASLGWLVGFIEMVWFERLFRNYSFVRKIFYKAAIYLVLIDTVIIFTFPVAASLESGLSLFDPEIYEKMRRFLMSLTFVNTVVQLGICILVSMVYAALSENLGHHVFINLLTGKYHKPVDERRIFMFLDMKDSTLIAEKLGHDKYFRLLRAYYHSMSNAIINHRGEVYQYIGDEVVITWNEKEGFENNNCINCFYAIKKALKKKADTFQATYGFAPDFKAGMHVGEVTTGEVGALKKEIVYTGDVLNTTARLQSLCTEYQTDLIISKRLMNGLQYPDQIQTKSLGEISLRGKTAPVRLNAVVGQ